MKERGIVKWFQDVKGYGFITFSDAQGKREAFVHFSDIQGKGHRKLEKGDVVECDVEAGDKGLRAVNVIVLERAS